jgi:exonuclease III
MMNITAKHSKVRHLSIASWNINGLGNTKSKTAYNNKLLDTKFIEQVSKHDIIFLQETHLQKHDQINIKGYHCKTFNNNKVKSNGKTDGGIATLFKTHLLEGISVLEQTRSHSIWCKLDKDFFGLEKPLFICASYLPHDSSTYVLNGDQDPLETLEQDILKHACNGYILLLGDLNARCGLLNDHIPGDSDDISVQNDNCDNYNVDKHLGTRCCQDLTVNDRGKKITDLCIQSRLRILNGRLIGDSTGRFTCHRPQGSSVVDFMIASEELLDRLKYFQVHDKLTLSDHCKISTLLACNIIKPTILNPIHLSPLPYRYTWNPDSPTAYQDALTSPDIQKELNSLYTYFDTKLGLDEERINNAVERITKIFHQVADKSLRKKTQNNTHTKKNKPWFNKTLSNLRQNVNKKGTLLTQFPADTNIRGSYYKSLKEYNRLRKQEQRKYKQSIVDKLDELQGNSPQEYWKLLKKLQQETENPAEQITAEQWQAHFSKLNTRPTEHNKNTPQQVDTDFAIYMTNAEINKHIEENEITQAIKTLKNNKATGLDGISNEMLKYGQHTFTKPLASLFNLILKSGNYPEQWSKGYISPIYKTGNPLSSDNYRGICINSCLGKLFNTVLNTRLTNYLNNHQVIHESQIAFNKGSRTSDHMFVLKTLIDKTVKANKKKLYTCFVDFKKAFDSLPHDMLLQKLKTQGINGNFFSCIKNMYAKAMICVKTQNKLTPFIQAEMGVRQGDVLSPNIFKIFINDLPQFLITNDEGAPKLNKKGIHCLLYADDLVILSQSKADLQDKLTKLDKYCSKWGLQINVDKTKTIIFSPNKTHTIEHFKIDNTRVECVSEYKYLGVIFSNNGSFEPAQRNLYGKGLKSYFKMSKLLSTEKTSVKTVLHLFDHTIKPILLYASEIWGTFNTNLTRIKRNPQCKLERAYDKLLAEGLHIKMCRYLLGVNPKTSIDAIRGECGRFPLYIEIATNLLKYYHYIKTKGTELLKDALACLEGMFSTGVQCWLHSIHLILDELQLKNADICQPLGKWLPRARHNLQAHYVRNWESRIKDETQNSQGQGKKLRTYKKFKVVFGRETYLDTIRNKNIRRSIAKLRTSSHKLHIETGRYEKPYKTVALRTCNVCHNNEVEDEEHFLMTCSAYSAEREKLFILARKHCQNFDVLTPENKMIWLFSNENGMIIRSLAEYIHICFDLRNILTSTI